MHGDGGSVEADLFAMLLVHSTDVRGAIWDDYQNGRNGDRTAQRDKALLGSIMCNKCAKEFVADTTGYQRLNVHYLQEHALRSDRPLGCDIGGCHSSLNPEFACVASYKRHAQSHAKSLGMEDEIKNGNITIYQATPNSVSCRYASCPQTLRNWDTQESYLLHLQLMHPIGIWEDEIRRLAPDMVTIDGFDPFLSQAIKDNQFFVDLDNNNRTKGRLRKEQSEIRDKGKGKGKIGRPKRSRKKTSRFAATATPAEVNELVGEGTEHTSSGDEVFSSDADDIIRHPPKRPRH
ncbi:hypothetical protein DL95DRAFT_390338 [Leptodontidium sp. 2 PMI_412]|nr:hypothetical protein DL95DRAFT_390338 [Leptodontidium sp. 2 PMI_412]